MRSAYPAHLPELVDRIEPVRNQKPVTLPVGRAMLGNKATLDWLADADKQKPFARLPAGSPLPSWCWTPSGPVSSPSTPRRARAPGWDHLWQQSNQVSSGIIQFENFMDALLLDTLGALLSLS